MEYYHPQQDHNQDISKPKFKRFRGVILLMLLVSPLVYAAFKVGWIPHSFWPFANVISFTQENTDDPNYVMPKEEKDRLDILLMGIRGENDPDAEDGGALLTDTMMVFSFDKKTKKASLVSIPRDLYVKLGKTRQEKLNAAYEYGLINKQGLDYEKKLISEITGVYIDNVLILDFSAFEKIIDQVGGVDLVLEQPFEEKSQWGYAFHLPAGKNHLDGKNALYYVRSRYSSNDFERSKRQQQVMMLLKDKLLKMNFLSDPVRSFEIVNTIRNNITTDINILKISALLDLAKNIDMSDIKHYVISTDNVVHDGRVNGSYVLYPNGGNFEQIKQLFANILTDNPLPTPATPLPSPKLK